MAKYIHIPRLDRWDLALCGCHTYHLIHGFCVKDKTHWNDMPVCSRCRNIGEKHPEKVHNWKPFKDRKDLEDYLTTKCNEEIISNIKV